MNEEILRKIEIACEQVFNAPTADGRQLAEQQLAGFSRVESVGELKLLMEKSTNAYALFYAATQMLKLFTTNWNSFSKEQKNEIRMLCIYIFQFVVHGGSNRSHHHHVSTETGFLILTPFLC